MTVPDRPTHRSRAARPGSGWRVVRALLLLAALLHAGAPLLRAASGACSTGTLAVAPAAIDAAAGAMLADLVRAARSEAGADAGEAALPGAAAGCTPSFAVVGPTQRLTAFTIVLRAQPRPLEMWRPSSHHPAPPFQPPRLS